MEEKEARTNTERKDEFARGNFSRRWSKAEVEEEEEEIDAISIALCYRKRCAATFSTERDVGKTLAGFS